MFFAVGSDNLLWALGLTDNLAGDSPTDFITDATITVTVSLAADQTTILATVSMQYVAGTITVGEFSSTGGNYRAQLPYTINFADATQYVTDVVIVSGSNRLELRPTIAAAYAT